MAIYGRTGDVVTVVRRAVLDDVKRLDGRKPDKQDREALANKSYVVIRQDNGKERLYHLAFLRATGGSREIDEAIRETDVRPPDEICPYYPEDEEKPHERGTVDADHCVYCSARLAPPAGDAS